MSQSTKLELSSRTLRKQIWECLEKNKSVYRETGTFILFPYISWMKRLCRLLYEPSLINLVKFLLGKVLIKRKAEHLLELFLKLIVALEKGKFCPDWPRFSVVERQPFQSQPLCVTFKPVQGQDKFFFPTGIECEFSPLHSSIAQLHNTAPEVYQLAIYQ